MSINEEIIETGRRRRRRHSASFKAEAVGACQQPGISVAAVALARGLNANLLHNWVRRAEREKTVIAIQRSGSNAAVRTDESFVPVTLPTTGHTTNMIRIEIRRKDRRVSIEWPASAAETCAVVLREMVK
jgi:transposase-like protein